MRLDKLKDEIKYNDDIPVEVLEPLTNFIHILYEEENIPNDQEFGEKVRSLIKEWKSQTEEKY